MPPCAALGRGSILLIEGTSEGDFRLEFDEKGSILMSLGEPLRFRARPLELQLELQGFDLER